MHKNIDMLFLCTAPSLSKYAKIILRRNLSGNLPRDLPLSIVAAVNYRPAAGLICAGSRTHLPFSSFRRLLGSYLSAMADAHRQTSQIYYYKPLALSRTDSLLPDLLWPDAIPACSWPLSVRLSLSSRLSYCSVQP